MTHIEPIDTKNHRQVDEFIALPFHLYCNTRQWVPPLEYDIRRIFNQNRYPYYKHNEAIFLIAYDDRGNPVGRLAVLNHRRYNEYNQKKSAFFYLFECINEIRYSNGLFEYASEWARQRGLNCIKGPRGFTVFDGTGMLVNGFDHRPAFGLPYNMDYYPVLVEAAGFRSEAEMLSGYLDSRVKIPDKVFQIADRLKLRRGLTIARYETRKDLRALVPKLKDLYNNSLAGTQDNVPLTDDEANLLAEQMIWFANPRLIKIVMKEEQPVGFLFAYPDISAALQRQRGKIFPLGWVDMLAERRRTKWININGAGMMEGYRGLGGTALLFSEMYNSVVEEGYLYADIVQISKDNDKMLRELRDLGVNFYKTHRLYTRQLT